MGTTVTGTKTFSYTNSSGGNQIWLKKTGANKSQVETWTFSVDGLPSGATITSSNLTFGVAYSYNSPARARVSWGTVDNTNVIYSQGSSFSSGNKGPYDLYTPGYLTTTGSKSITFYKQNSSKGTTYIAYSSPVVKVGYSYPIGDPTPPTSVSVNSTNVGPNTNVTLSWSGAGAGANNAISGYHIYRSTSASGTYSYLAAVTTTATSGSYTVTSPSNNSSYYYKVYTIGAAGYNSVASSSYATLTTTYTAPNPPTSVLVNGASSAYVAEGGTLTLSWSGASNGTNQAVLSYKVYVDGALYIESITASSITVPSFGAGAHSWTIYSVGAYSTSSQSPAATAYTYSAPTAPTAFTITPATTAINSKITLSWSGASSGAYNNIVGYEISRDGASLGTTTNTTISYISPPTAGTYTYTIKTLGERSNSSSVASATLTTTVPSWAEWNEEEDMYIKQNFVHGQIVTADNLNHIEEGLEAISANARARNLLDNSLFEIAQAGYPGQHGSKWFVADRWEAEKRPNTVMYDNHFAFNANDGGELVVLQKTTAEIAAKLIGKTITLAVYTDADEILCASGTVAYDQPVAQIVYGDQWSLQLQFFQSVGSYQLARFVLNAGKTVNIKWVALYEGSYTVETLPPYVPKGYAVELMECQRYYIRVKTFQVAGQTFTTGARFGFALPMPMRITPTMTLLENGTIICNGVKDVAVTGGTVVDVLGNRIKISTEHASQSGWSLQTGTWLDGEFELSADL